MGLTEILSRLNWVDILSLILLFRISYVAFHRGFGNEVVPLIGDFTALIITLHYHTRIGNYLASHTSFSSTYSNLIGYIFLVLIIKLLFSFFESLIVYRIFTFQVVSLFDRLGGLIIGVIRAIIFISIVLIALEFIPNGYIHDSLKKKSLMSANFLRAGHFIYERTSAFLRMK